MLFATTQKVLSVVSATPDGKGLATTASTLTNVPPSRESITAIKTPPATTQKVVSVVLVSSVSLEMV